MRKINVFEVNHNENSSDLNCFRPILSYSYYLALSFTNISTVHMLEGSLGELCYDCDLFLMIRPSISVLLACV
jgi:hypothetical protein